MTTLNQITAQTDPIPETAIIYVLVDPSGTPLDRKSTIALLRETLGVPQGAYQFAILGVEEDGETLVWQDNNGPAYSTPLKAMRTEFNGTFNVARDSDIYLCSESDLPDIYPIPNVGTENVFAGNRSVVYTNLPAFTGTELSGSTVLITNTDPSDTTPITFDLAGIDLGYMTEFNLVQYSTAPVTIINSAGTLLNRQNQFNIAGQNGIVNVKLIDANSSIWLLSGDTSLI